MKLPNLNDLSLSGFPAEAVEGTFQGMGAALSGRFGGRLQLHDRCANKDVMNLLLEVPTGLSFTEVEIRGRNVCLLSTVRLVETCGETLARLTCAVTVPTNGGREACRRSFGLAKFPNLHEVDFEVNWVGGGIPWIPMTLSTLKPATSPHLSTIRLGLFVSYAATRPIETSIEDVGNDLRRIADEVDRIDREFDGVVDFTVLLGSGFREVLNTLNILQRWDS